MSHQPEHDLITRLYANYNAHNLAGWLETFAEAAVWINIPTGETYTGPEEQKQNYFAWNTPFPNGKCEDLVVRSGDGFAVAEFNGVGMHEGPLITVDSEIAATGLSTSFAFCDVHTIADGKITRTHRYWDLAGATAQLGR